MLLIVVLIVGNRTRNIISVVFKVLSIDSDGWVQCRITAHAQARRLQTIGFLVGCGPLKSSPRPQSSKVSAGGPQQRAQLERFQCRTIHGLQPDGPGDANLVLLRGNDLSRTSLKPLPSDILSAVEEQAQDKTGTGSLLSLILVDIIPSNSIDSDRSSLDDRYSLFPGCFW